MESRLPLDQRFNGKVKRPKELIAWSEGPGKSITFDDRALRYYYFPIPQLVQGQAINLAKGFDATKFDPDAKRAVYIDNVLKAVMQYENDTGEKVAAHVITWRGLLTQLIYLSQYKVERYALNESFEYLITGFDNQVFMSQDDVMLKSKPSISDPNHLRLMYTGFQFEHVATLPKPWGELSRDEIENRYTTGYLAEEGGGDESYGALIKSGIGNVDVVYGAEMDCVENYKPTDASKKLCNYVELKTSRAIDSPQQARGFERKLLKTWIQSFLSGVPKIVYAFRNDDLELQTVEEYRTDDLPKLVKKSTFTYDQNKWNGNDVIAFYAILMQWIKDKVEDGKSYRLIYKAHTHHFVLQPTEINIEGRDVSFLSNEFVNWRRT